MTTSEYVRTPPIVPYGAHTTVSDLSSAVAITPPAIVSDSKEQELEHIQLMIEVFTQNTRFTLDGTTPTASTGFQLSTGNIYFFLLDTRQSTFQIIEESGGATCQYQWMQGG